MAGSSGFGGGSWGSKAHGSARWMTPEEAHRLRMFEFCEHSVFIGQNSRGDFAFHNGDGHLLVLAPSRTGKGVGFVQGNLLTYRGSMVITDPKGENAAVSWRTRKERHGQSTYVLDPFHLLASLDEAARIPTHHFNPLAAFDLNGGDRLIDDIRLVADALLVPETDAREAHWRDGAKSYLTALLTFLVSFYPSDQRHLPMLNRLANGLERPVDEIFTILVNNPHPDPKLKEAIALTGSWWDKVNPKERASFVSMALRGLNWLNSPRWHQQLTRSDFHPYELKSGMATIYIVCPFEQLKEYSPWFRLVLTSCIVAILRAPKQTEKPTLFLLDEYASAIGSLAAIEETVPFILGSGARYAMIFQKLSQMAEIWPEPKYHGVFADAGACVFHNVNDLYTAEYVSRFIGKYGAMQPGGHGTSFISRDLLDPNEVMTLDPGDLILFVRNQKPARLGKVFAPSHPLLSPLLESNPSRALRTEAPAMSGVGASLVLDPNAALGAVQAKGSQGVSALLRQLSEKYPDKELSLEGDMVGYFQDEAGTKIFIPLAHRAALEALAD